MKSEASGDKSSRQPELDILRALAVILVLGRHVLYIPTSLEPHVRSFFLHWRWGGWIGVDLFFVISGFLISGLFFKEFLKTNSIRPGRFLIRRGFKIYPAFYVFLILATWPTYSIMKTHFSWVNFWGEIFFLQNYVGSLCIHTWTLAIEEHFYFLLALIFFLRFRYAKSNNPFSFIWKSYVLLAIALLAARCYLAYVLKLHWQRTIMPSHLRIDTLYLGVVISFFYSFHRDKLEIWARKFRALNWVFGVVVVVSAFRTEFSTNPFMCSVGPTLLAFAFGGLLINFLFLPDKAKEYMNSHLKIFLIIGRHSYSIYLWHVAAWAFTLKLIGHFFTDWFIPQTILYFFTSLLLGSLMSILVEQPFLRFRDRVFPKES